MFEQEPLAPRNLKAIHCLFYILLISFLIKLTLIVALPSIHHPDENFQALEQAHRLAFGFGISPWEFRDGVRSMVLPGVLAGIFELTARFSDNPFAYITISRAFMALISLVGVACVYTYAKKISVPHAIISSLVLAIWFEAIFFSFRPLTEFIAATCLVSSISFGLKGRLSGRWHDFLLAGFFASATVMLRFHLSAGVLVLALFVCRFSFYDKWVPFALGGMTPASCFWHR